VEAVHGRSLASASDFAPDRRGPGRDRSPQPAFDWGAIASVTLAAAGVVGAVTILTGDPAVAAYPVASVLV
jgi:hypothetical protein